MTWVFAIATGGWTLVLLLGHTFNARKVVIAAKLLASSGFIAAALAAGAIANDHGRWILVALALGWCGDALLLVAARRAFLAGLIAFALGHLAFSIAWVMVGVEPGALAFGGAASAIAAILAWRWLSPHSRGPMRAPVAGYVAVSALMLALALGTLRGASAPQIPLGAICFFASDLAVARERFVHPGLANRWIGLPLYYAAQLLFAAS